MIALGVQRSYASLSQGLFACRGDDREPRREGRRFSSSTHEMRQPDAANRPERWSVGCGLFESRRRSLGAMGLGEPWVSHRAAAAETDQCGDVGVQVGDCYRRADTSSRDKPQPTQTVPAPLDWSPRNHRGMSREATS